MAPKALNRKRGKGGKGMGGLWYNPPPSQRSEEKRSRERVSPCGSSICHRLGTGGVEVSKTAKWQNKKEYSLQTFVSSRAGVWDDGLFRQLVFPNNQE